MLFGRFLTVFRLIFRGFPPQKFGEVSFLFLGILTYSLLKRRKLLILRQFSIIPQIFPFVNTILTQNPLFFRKFRKKLVFLRKKQK